LCIDLNIYQLACKPRIFNDGEKDQRMVDTDALSDVDANY